MLELHLTAKNLANFHPIAMKRRNNDMRRLVFSQLHDQIRQVRFKWCNPGSLQCLVQPNLIGGHRLHLDDFALSSRANQVDNDPVRLIGIARPVHTSARFRAVALKFLQIAIQMRERVLLDRVSRFAQRLPIRHLIDYPRPLPTNHIRRMTDVPPQLRIRDQRLCRTRKSFRLCRMSHVNTHALAARISARCAHFTPVRIRLSAPLICMRHELSVAVQTSAPVLSTHRILSASMAAETSAFLIANVPPNPQHCSASGNSIKRSPRTLSSSWRGLLPRPSDRSP